VDASAPAREDGEVVVRKVGKKLAANPKKATREKRTIGLEPRPRASRQESAPELDQGTRDKMVAGAASLLAQRGLQATSFSEVLEFTGAPRGSIYHHFPGGKEQLIKAALDLVTAQMARFFSPREGAPPEEVTDLFLRIWRSVLLRSQFKAGCAVVAVTVAADSPELLEYAAAIFRAWRGRLARLLVAGGLAQGDAARFAATLIAASEGAVVLSRGEQSLEPFEMVASQLVEQARSFPRKG
jgi:TetR/AcrR family transcriptional repressor of lmrAB and yxaGH operons